MGDGKRTQLGMQIEILFRENEGEEPKLKATAHSFEKAEEELANMESFLQKLSYENEHVISDNF